MARPASRPGRAPSCQPDRMVAGAPSGCGRPGPVQAQKSVHSPDHDADRFGLRHGQGTVERPLVHVRDGQQVEVVRGSLGIVQTEQSETGDPVQIRRELPVGGERPDLLPHLQHGGGDPGDLGLDGADQREVVGELCDGRNPFETEVDQVAPQVDDLTEVTVEYVRDGVADLLGTCLLYTSDAADE